MVLNTPVIWRAKAVKLATAAMAIKLITRAYSTRSWPSSRIVSDCSLSRILQNRVFIKAFPKQVAICDDRWRERTHSERMPCDMNLSRDGPKLVEELMYYAAILLSQA